MPQAAIAAVANFFLAVTGAYSVTATAIALFAAKVFVYAAASYLLNRAAESMAKRPRGGGLGQGMEINYYDSGAPIRIVYGRVRTGGMETIPAIATGQDNAYLHKVLTLAGHEVDSYNYAHFDTTTITNAQIGAMTFTGSDGAVSSGDFGGNAWIRRYRGTSTDSADRMLMEVDSAAFNKSRAPGIAKAAVTFLFNADVFRSMPIITFTYQGKRCYDPRLDTSPGANPTNSAYIAWTQCPALCLCDYLMGAYGGDYTASDIDWDTVVTAANYCDATVSTPSGLQARYTCNGVLLATDKFEDNVRMLVDSMLGRIIFRDGKWRVYAGSWQTPSFTIQKEDWIEGGLSIRFEQGRSFRFNRMRCWYIDSAREWQRVESLPRYNPTYATADAESIDAQTEQLLCTVEYEAQRKAEMLLRQSRNQITVTGRLPPRFQDIALWDTGTIVFDHLGWSTKTFRAVGVDMNPDGSMDCVFSEEQSTDWSDLISGDYNAPSAATLPAINANPVVAAAQFWDRVNPDAEFTAASSLYWNWFPNSWGPAAIWSLDRLNTGALYGSKAVLLPNSMQSRPLLSGRRATDSYPTNVYPWRDGGPGANVTVRWRRTSSVYDANSASTNPFIALEWNGSDGVSASKIFFQGTVNSSDRIYPNQFAANSWHAVTFSSQPAPGTIQAGMPQLTFYITSGQIEIDAFDARQL